MKRLLLVFTLFNIGVASAQLKTYNGSFEDGSANYTYKEEGIFHINQQTEKSLCPADILMI